MEQQSYNSIKAFHEVILKHGLTSVDNAGNKTNGLLNVTIDESVNSTLKFISKQPESAQQIFHGLLKSDDMVEFSKQPFEVREKLISAWNGSDVRNEAALCQLFVLLSGLPLAFYSSATHEAMDYNPANVVETANVERLPILDELQNNEYYDVIIIGSGAGGGVVAAESSKNGKQVLVIEQAKYLHESEMPYEEAKAFESLYTPGFATMAPNMLSLGGKAVGGGTAVNYLASFEPPMNVREDWKNNFGLDFLVGDEFQKCIEEVKATIGATTDGIQHSKATQKFIEGAQKLGYHIEDIPQNTGGKPHNDGYCSMGCRMGVKNGSMNTWLRDAVKHGAKIADQTRATQILHVDKIVQGVECVRNGTKYTLNAEKVIVCGGSLYSPCLLKDSGLENKNVGENFSLHPLATVLALSEEETNMNQGALMTAFSKVDVGHTDKSGDETSCIIELFSVHPGLYTGMLPFENSETYIQDMLNYKHGLIYMVLQRDIGEGTVTMNNGDLHVEYKASDDVKENLMKGTIQACRISAAFGSTMIKTCQTNVPPFRFKPDEESSVDNPRFEKWLQLVESTGFQEGYTTFGSGHQMSTCRMGSTPENSVVNKYGESWEIKNLYVADGSVVPTGIGRNPMVTIESFALWIAKNLVERRDNDA